MSETSQSPRRDRADASDTLLRVGLAAPDFTLSAGPGETHSLDDYRGHPVVLVFYPADWSPVCGDQLALYNQLKELWSKMGVQLLAISVDGAWSHRAYSSSRHLSFPLLADFEPKGAVSRMYNAYEEKEGTAKRALYVLDADGVIQWRYLSPVNINPGADGILNALEKLTPEQRGSATRDRRSQTAPARPSDTEARP